MKFKYFAILLIALSLYSCKKETFTLNKIEGKQINISDTLAVNQDIEGFIKPFRERINKDMDSVISYAPETYIKNDGEYNTAIGNLMADLVFEQGNLVFNKRTGKNIDAVLLNYGGIRSIISKGNITTRTAFEVMPFENSIVVVALKGNQIDSMTQYLSRAKKAHPISGLKLRLDKNLAITEALINKEPIEANKTYYVATNDYLYNGGDGMLFFKTNDTVYDLNYKIRNAMIDYFKKVDTIKPVIDDRFIQTK